MATTTGKTKYSTDQEIINSLNAKKIDDALALQLLKIRREIMDLLQLLRGL
ncbi:MAG: hypothetical protein QM762_11200 [Chryseolinea sp.]